MINKCEIVTFDQIYSNICELCDVYFSCKNKNYTSKCNG